MRQSRRETTHTSNYSERARTRTHSSKLHVHVHSIHVQYTNAHIHVHVHVLHGDVYEPSTRKALTCSFLELSDPFLSRIPLRLDRHSLTFAWLRFSCITRHVMFDHVIITWCHVSSKATSKMAGNDDWLYNDDLDVGLPGVREGDGGSSEVVVSGGPRDEARERRRKHGDCESPCF